MSYISRDELFDEYLSQPTPELLRRMADAAYMAGDSNFSSAIYSAEPNVSSFWAAVAEGERWLYEQCQAELVERGFETH